MESKKLYVGNLNYSVTNQDLEELFSEYGTVDSVNVIEGKGFGFVEMADAAEAEKAKKGLSESSFKGRALRVDEANPPASSDRRGPEASSSPPPPEVPTEDWSLLSEEEAKERIQKMVEDASLKETGFGARRFYFVTRESLRAGWRRARRRSWRCPGTKSPTTRSSRGLWRGRCKPSIPIPSAS